MGIWYSSGKKKSKNSHYPDESRALIFSLICQVSVCFLLPNRPVLQSDKNHMDINMPMEKSRELELGENISI